MMSIPQGIRWRSYSEHCVKGANLESGIQPCRLAFKALVDK